MPKKPSPHQRVLQDPQTCSHRIDDAGQLEWEEYFSGGEYRRAPSEGDTCYPIIWKLGNPARAKFDGQRVRVLSCKPHRTAYGSGYLITAELAQ